jgi:HKD family nuclease
MRLITNNSSLNHKSEIINSLNKTEELIICVAFLKSSGLNLILNKIKELKVKAIFYIGLDFYLTEPKALKAIFKSGYELHLTSIAKITYHSKIYYFKNKEQNSAIIGSANLTKGGLDSNIETSISITFDNKSEINEQILKQINYINNNSKQVFNLQPILEYEEEYKSFHKNIEEAEKKFKTEKKRILKKRTNTPREKRKPAITEEYRKKWPENFEEFKTWKKRNNGNPIVSKHHKLHKWYQTQKNLYNYIDENGKRLIPTKHFDLLEAEGFYWENGRELSRIRRWEENLGKCMEYSFLKNQPYVWVVWEQKDPKFKYKKYAHWCIRQRQRINGKDKTPITKYELKRLREVKFLIEDSNENRYHNDDSFIINLLKLSDYINARVNKNESKWLPSQTDKDPEVAELGNWLNDSLEWIKRQLAINSENVAALERENEFLKLGIFKEGVFKSYFVANAEKYVEMRKKYPLQNPRGEERKPYQNILKWATENKSRFESFPKWRKDKLIEIGLMK